MAAQKLELDFFDPVWIAVREYAAARVEVLARALEKKGMTQADTDFLRGQVRELRNLIEQEAPPSRPSSETAGGIYT